MTSDSPRFRCSRTISMETGCQNIQLCVVILRVAFTPKVIGPMSLFPLLYFTFQCTEALLLALCFRCYQAFKPPAEGKCHSCLCFQREAGRRGHMSTCAPLQPFVAVGLLTSDQRKSNITLLFHRCEDIRQC